MDSFSFFLFWNFFFTIPFSRLQIFAECHVLIIKNKQVLICLFQACCKVLINTVGRLLLPSAFKNNTALQLPCQVLRKEMAAFTEGVYQMFTVPSHLYRKTWACSSQWLKITCVARRLLTDRCCLIKANTAWICQRLPAESSWSSQNSDFKYSPCLL